MTIKPFVLVSFALMLAGCGATQPLKAASIRYKLPRTDVEATLTLVLTDCSPDDFSVEAQLALAAAPGAQEPWYELDGAALASATIRRGLTVETKGDVLSSVNSSNSNRTAQIAGNTLKTAAVLVGMVVKNLEAPRPRVPSCTRAVVMALRAAKRIQDRIDDLREALAQNPSKQIVEEIDGLAAQLAAIQTGILTIQIKKTIKFERPPVPSAAAGQQVPPRSVAGTIPLEDEAFEKWFGESLIDQAGLRMNVADLFLLKWTATENARVPLPALTGKHAGKRAARECRLSLVAPQPVTIDVEVEGGGRVLGKARPVLQKKLSVPAAHWSDPAELCIDARVGETREIGLTFDAYGQATKFSWTSEATAENVSAAVAGAAPDAASIGSAIIGPSAAEKEKSEIDRLERQQKLNKLRKCQAILDAGGFKCPEE